MDRLPQVFVIKYLGHRKVSGVCGLHHVRRPVDEMVREVKDQLDKSSDVSGLVMMVFLSNFGFLDEFFCHFLVLQACPLAVDAAAQKI